jgi:hypothetical protein
MKGLYYTTAARLVQSSDRLTDARLHQRVEELDATGELRVLAPNEQPPPGTIRPCPCCSARALPACLSITKNTRPPRPTKGLDRRRPNAAEPAEATHFTLGKARVVFLRSVSIGVSHRFWTTTTQDTGQKGQPYQKAFSITLHRIITRHKIVELRPKSWAGKLCGIKGFSFGTKIGSFYHFYCWLSLLFLLNLTVGIAKTNTRKPLGRRRD